MGPPPAERPPSVVTTAWSKPLVGHHAGDRPAALGGPVSTCCVPDSPTRPAPWPWTSPMSTRQPGGAAAGTPARRRPRATIDLVAAGHGHPPHHRIPSAPMQAGDHPPAATGAPRPTAPSRAVPTPSPSRSSATRTTRRHSADSGGLSVRTRGHRTRGHRTPGHGTSDRPAGRTSHGGTGRGNHRPGRRPDIPAPATTRWAARPHPGHSAGGAWPPRTAPR
jgi:hypothetical protein